MSRLLAFIFLFLRLGVDDTQPGGDDSLTGDTPPSGEGDDTATDGGAVDADLDTGEDTLRAEPADTDKDRIERERQELRSRAERAEREAAELRVRATPRPTDAQEEDENRKLADPQVSDLEKWQIRSNRTMRANTTATQLALHQAMDVRDQTSFKIITSTDARAKKYETRVEEELTKARAAGGNPSREAIYTYLLGKDMREGKFTKKKADPAPRKEHGKLPGARSDVSARSGTQSKRDQLAKKLDGVQI